MTNKPASSSNPAGAQGFTLIELLVVVSILAAIAGISASVVGNYEWQAREQLAHTEMKTIANAIYRFRQDTGYFPRTGIFSPGGSTATEMADVDFLFNRPKDSSGKLVLWYVEDGRGWNGPYLSADSERYLHIPYSLPLKSDCDGGPVDIEQRVVALEDTFDRVKEYTSDDSCFVLREKGFWIPEKASGQPYRYVVSFENNSYPRCTIGSPCIALLSAGPNGLFENGDNDDIVKILRTSE
jgi:prepilin-type N-terminal cleavage/methylation domain-containing protein